MPRAVIPTSPAPRPEDLLQYSSLYKVVVCTSCRYAIQPRAISRHLKEIHMISSSDRKSFMQYVEKFELAEHEIVMQYAPSEFPVPLLPVHSGLQCIFEECTYLCVTQKRMRHHWLSVHGRQGLLASDWQHASLQTFFMGNLLRYFTGRPLGNPTEKGISRIDSLARIDNRAFPDAKPPASSNPLNISRSLNPSEKSIMHHFITQTWVTLTTGENTRQMWQIIVPQLAYEHGYLMHALLSCGALHMAYLDPDERLKLTLQARTYQNHALPLFRAAISSVESKTCDAIYTFALLMGIIAFVLDESFLMAGEDDDMLPNWLFMIQSGCTMFCDVWDRIETGPVKYMADSWQIMEQMSEFPHQPLLDYLLAIPPDDWPEEVQVPYKASALALGRTFSCLDVLDERITVLDIVRFWPIKNSLEYVELLSNWHPGALILLAHYCIVLRRVEAKSWYLKGRAASILSTTVRRLDLIWHRYIEWPLIEVGPLPLKCS